MTGVAHMDSERYAEINIVDEAKTSSTTGAAIIMSQTQSTEQANSTRDEAIAALKHMKKNYRGYSEEFMQEPLVKILTGENDRVAQRGAATEFRNLIWGWLSGGGVAELVTTAVFKELGREDELELLT